MSTDLEARIAALEAELADLRRQQVSGQRLGPAPETQADVDARVATFVGDVCISGPESIKAVPPVDRTKLCTTDGRSAAEARASQTNETGQHPSYIVLCEEERRRGFVRPYRDTYKHVGSCGKEQPPVEDQIDRFFCLMVKGHDGPCLEFVHGEHPGRGCGSVTTMGRALSETYARDPKFYGATFCVSCNRHLPVAEFVWTADGKQVGS